MTTVNRYDDFEIIKKHLDYAVDSDQDDAIKYLDAMKQERDAMRQELASTIRLADSWCNQWRTTNHEMDQLKQAAKEAAQILATIRDQTYVDAEPPELRGQNECNYRRANEALAALAQVGIRPTDTHGGEA